MTDNGLSPRSADKRVEIFTAKEFSAPAFTRALSHTLDLAEDTPVGTVVATLASDEPDAAFGVAGGDVLGCFGVDAATGEVFVRRALDREAVAAFDLWVKVFHARRPLFFAAERIAVTVRDVNDNAPEFFSPLVKVRTQEEQYPPFFVAEVTASDADEGANADVVYAVAAEDDDGDFSVDPRSGIVTCNVRLDREAATERHLRVVAADGGDPPLTSTATVLVEVEDINDNAPLFTRLHSVNVSEGAAVGAVLLRVETRDLDTPPNANVTYRYIYFLIMFWQVHLTVLHQ